jgi:hypothetical protein
MNALLKHGLIILAIAVVAGVAAQVVYFDVLKIEGEVVS